ncbi:hypothetical protein BU17DRAFT_69025 [Hysterangium stoloniferum]|nr:hypothetical protein BU17DRAFT_69025 [Hysterangium stoloniferum]
MYMKPFQVVKEAVSMNVTSNCILVSMMEKLAAKGDVPAGEEGVIVAPRTPYMQQGQYEKQKKAQRELDREIGNRLPTLRIASAFLMFRRWVTQDEGILFRKAASSLEMPGRLFRDENVYGPRTDEFEPERFLTFGVRPYTEQSGIGRRICPGRYMAENTVFIAVASILKVFEISKPLDEHGKGIDISNAYTTGAMMSSFSSCCLCT